MLEILFYLWIGYVSRDAQASRHVYRIPTATTTAPTIILKGGGCVDPLGNQIVPCFGGVTPPPPQTQTTGGN